jgi:hypothetical protein
MAGGASHPPVARSKLFRLFRLATIARNSKGADIISLFQVFRLFRVPKSIPGTRVKSIRAIVQPCFRAEARMHTSVRKISRHELIA